MKKIIFLFFILFISVSLYAVNNTWTGNVSTLWSAAGNWSLGRVPISTDDVVIPTAASNNPYITASLGYTGNCRTLIIQSGKTLRVGYATINITYDMTIYGHLYFSSANAVINVGDDIFWKSGSTELIDQGNIYVKGDWTFEDGTNCTLGTGNTVIFNGTANQFLYVYDANSYFGNMAVNQTGSVALWLQNASTYDIQVDGSLTLSNNSLLQVQSNTLIVDGTLDIEDGSKMYLEHSGGELINNSTFTLDGEMYINGGDVQLGYLICAETGILTIDAGSLSSNYLISIYGTFSMSNGIIDADREFIINATATTNISGGLIRCERFCAQHFETFQPTGGTVEMDGNIFSWSWFVCSNGNFFWNLTIDLSSVSASVVPQSNITVQNNLEIVEGFLYVYDNEINVDNNVNIYGSLTMDNSADVLNVGNDITWFSGSNDYNLTDGNINVSGDWYFHNGTDVQLGIGTTVNFVGSGSQLIYNFDDNASFGNVTINKPDIMPVWLDNSSTHDFQIDGDLTLTNNSRLQVQAKTLIVDGTLDIQNGSKMYLEHTGGELINNSDFTLNGELEIDGGDVLCHGHFDLASSGTLTINGGSFISDASYSGSNYCYISGAVNISDGLFEITNNSVRIGETCAANVTGGTMWFGRGFYAHYAETFQPTGGYVQVNTQVECYDGNFFYNLETIGTGTCQTGSNITVLNDLQINCLFYVSLNYEVTVNNNVHIYDRISAYENPIINAGNDIIWYNGSSANIDNATVNISGDWYFNDGTDAQLGTGNTVNFNGSTTQNIYCYDADASFGSIGVNKTTGNLVINTASTQPMRVAGDMDLILVNDFYVQGEELIVDGTLDIYDGSAMGIGNFGFFSTNSYFWLNGELNITGGDVLIHGGSNIMSTGIMTINGGSFIYDAPGSGVNYIYGTLNLSDGLYSAYEMINIQASATTNITGGTLRSQIGLDAQHVNTFQPTGGVFEVYRDLGGVGLTTCSNGNYFYNFKVSCSSGGAQFNSDITVQNDLEINSGQLSINGHSIDVGNSVYVYDILQMNNALDILNVGNDINWYSASSRSISDGEINVSGDWYFHNGTDVQLGVGNTVNFVGSETSLIYCYDADASFGSVTSQKSVLATWIDNSSTYDMQVTGDMTVQTGNFHIQDNELLVDGVLDIDDGAKMTIGNSGNLTNNSDFELYGELDVGTSGDVLIHGEFDLEPTGILAIDGGSFIYDEGNGLNIINGIFNFSEGLYSAAEQIFIGPTATTNITGGTIRSQRGLHATYLNTFQPSGGVLEVNKDFAGYAAIECSDGNYFYDFKVNSSYELAGASFQSDILIQNNLEIIDGILLINEYEIDVLGDIRIYDRLWMDDPAGIINIGQDFTWISGSSDYNLTNGNINVSGDWYFHDGTLAQLGTGNTVNFVGSEHSTIYCDDHNACFGNINIDKNTSNDKVSIFDGDVCRAAGVVDISGGYLFMGDLTTLEIGNSLNINSGGKFDAGANDDACTITKYGTGPYAFNVESGGTIDASSTTFEYMDASGVNVKSGATVDASSLFLDCIFRNGETGGTLLTIDNAQAINIDNVEFYAGAKDAAYNITKNLDQGHLTFTNVAGDLVGPAYENDMYDRIDWTGYAPDLTITSTVWSDTNTVICSAVDVDVTVKNTGNAACGGCVLDIYYNLDAPPSPSQSGQNYSAIPGLDPGDSLIITFDQICTDVIGTWNSYFQVDTDQNVSESNEDNNVWGPDEITWNALPYISDLIISYNSGTDEVELSWFYPIGVDSFYIYRDSTPSFTPAPINKIASTIVTDYSEEVSGDKYFYKVTAVKTCPSPPIYTRNRESSIINNR